MGNRDTRVYNYARHMMYEIWNNDKPLRVYYCKTTNSVLDSSKVPNLLAEYEVQRSVCSGNKCWLPPAK